MKSYEPKDLIALLVIIGLIAFKLTGHNGTFDAPVAMILGYYFARRQDTQVILKPDNAIPTGGSAG